MRWGGREKDEGTIQKHTCSALVLISGLSRPGILGRGPFVEVTFTGRGIFIAFLHWPQRTGMNSDSLFSTRGRIYKDDKQAVVEEGKLVENGLVLPLVFRPSPHLEARLTHYFVLNRSSMGGSRLLRGRCLVYRLDKPSQRYHSSSPLPHCPSYSYFSIFSF